MFFAAVAINFINDSRIIKREQRVDIIDRVMAVLAGVAEFRRRAGRPYVTLTYAQSLDGSIAARPGHPLALSCQESRVMTHALRAAHDAILVGIGTVLADNPRLTVRLVEGKNPQPVVMDSRLRCPPYAHLLQPNCIRPWIATSHLADPERQTALEKLGAHIFRLPTGPHSMINLSDLLTYLADKGINTLMVEGGAQIIANFLASRLVDQIIVTIAPVVVGGLRVVDNVNLFQSNNFPRLGHLFYQQVGGDLVVRGEPSWPAS